MWICYFRAVGNCFYISTPVTNWREQEQCPIINVVNNTSCTFSFYILDDCGDTFPTCPGCGHAAPVSLPMHTSTPIYPDPSDLNCSIPHVCYQDIIFTDVIGYWSCITLIEPSTATTSTWTVADGCGGSPCTGTLSFDRLTNTWTIN